MPVKESSDQSASNNAATAGEFVLRDGAKRTFGDYVALAIATWGVGYFPIAPGTWGSLVGVGIFLLLQQLRIRLKAGSAGAVAIGMDALWVAIYLVVILVISLAGVWAATRVEAMSKRKDPGIVVADEVAGQLITLLVVPIFGAGIPWLMIFTGFMLFRLFDIWKPYPIRRLEGLESGLGVMADDILAGAYAALALSMFVAIYFLI